MKIRIHQTYSPIIYLKITILVNSRQLPTLLHCWLQLLWWFLPVGIITGPLTLEENTLIFNHTDNQLA